MPRWQTQVGSWNWHAARINASFARWGAVCRGTGFILRLGRELESSMPIMLAIAMNKENMARQQ